MKRVASVVIGAVLLLAVAGAPSAHAAVKGVGWWSDAPTASAPEGGIAIGTNPGGPSAVAAVLLDLGEGSSRGSITLRQSGGAAPGGAAIVACVVGSFTPVEHGAMADAPATACETTSTPLKLAGDGVTWSADITDLLGDRRGTVGLALVPAPGTALWDLQFDTVSATVSPAATSGPASGGGGSTATTMAPRPATSSSASPSPSASSPRPTSSSFSAPRPPAVAAPAASSSAPTAADASDAATDAGSADTEIAAGGSVALPTAASTGVTSEPSGTASQAMGYVLLAAVVGVIGGVGHRVASRRMAAA